MKRAPKHKPAPQTPFDRRRRRWHQSEETLSLGCAACAILGECGGIRGHAHRYDCFDDCCNDAGNCNNVCPKNPTAFKDWMREIGGFEFLEFSNLPAPRIRALPDVAPVIYHGNRRAEPLVTPWVALPLFKVLHPSKPRLKFETPAELRRAFRLAPFTRIILTGVDRDPIIERAWRLSDKRREVFAQLAELNIECVTSPNFSVFCDVPRTDNLHSLARITHVFVDAMDAGVASALHVNGNSDRDYERLAIWIDRHPFITHVSIDFSTGTGWGNRGAQHARWLRNLARYVRHPLSLITRGGVRWLPQLADVFTHITVLDTNVFMRTLHRQAAEITPTGVLKWNPTLTLQGQTVDHLMADNVRTIRTFYARQSHRTRPNTGL